MHGVYGKKHGVHSGCGNFMQMAHIGRKSTVPVVYSDIFCVRRV